MKYEFKDMYVVDYDLPVDTTGRRQFYRYLNKLLAECHWRKSSNSVILVDSLPAALTVLQLARAFNAHHANVGRAVPVQSRHHLFSSKSTTFRPCDNNLF